MCDRWVRIRASATGEVDRLGDVVIGAQTEGLDDVGAFASGGDHDDRELRLRTLDTQPGQHLEAAHARHLDIQQDQVERVPIDLGERLGAIGGDCDEIALLLQAP